MSANGRLTHAQLAPIGGGLYLRKDAAAAFLAMSAEARRRWGRPIRARDAYRPLGAPGDYARGRWSQWAAWEKFRFHGGNLAAFPGTSNHGLGTTIDLMTVHDRWMVDQIGAKYGWAKRCSDAPSEWWHVKDNPGCTHASWHPPHPLPTIRYRRGRLMHGRTVKRLNRILRLLGFRSVKHGSGYYGLASRRAVKRIQKKHGIKADGVVGAKTWRLLLRLVHN